MLTERGTPADRKHETKSTLQLLGVAVKSPDSVAATVAEVLKSMKPYVKPRQSIASFGEALDEAG